MGGINSKERERTPSFAVFHFDAAAAAAALSDRSDDALLNTLHQFRFSSLHTRTNDNDDDDDDDTTMRSDLS